jgi:hypothetical protein
LILPELTYGVNKNDKLFDIKKNIPQGQNIFGLIKVKLVRPVCLNPVFLHRLLLQSLVCKDVWVVSDDLDVPIPGLNHPIIIDHAPESAEKL